MFGKVAAWFLKNPLVVILLVITAMFVVITLGKNGEIRAKDETIATKEQRIEALNGAVVTWRNNAQTALNSLEKQNQMIDALAAQGEEQGRRFDSALAGLSASTATISQRISRLSSATPPAPGERCEAALDLVGETLR